MDASSDLAADSFDIEAILAEIAVDQVGENAQVHDPALSTRSTGICLESLEEAFTALLSDACIMEDVKETICKVDRNALLPALKWLDGCLVKKGKFKTVAKEKAYSNFYQQFLAHQKALESLTSSDSSTCTWICLKVFDIMLDKCYNHLESSSTEQDENTEVPQDEIGIVEYIGGYVIYGLKKQACRLSEADEKTNRLKCLEELTMSDKTSNIATSSNSTSTSPKSLTQLFDRGGGLTKLKPNVFQIFVTLESIFRSCFNGEMQVLSFDLYFSKCCQADSVSTCLYEQMYKISAPEKTKENILHGIVRSYFAVRAHHKCKTYMDKHRLATKTSKNQKGFRKALKQCQHIE